MARKLLMECPKCHRINEKKISFFSSNYVDCLCGYTLSVKEERMKTKQCPHCGNLNVYDAVNKEEIKCLVCKKDINVLPDMNKFVEIICPTCSCMITASKDDNNILCPMCDTKINVKQRLAQLEFIKQKQPILIQCEMPKDVCVLKHPLENFSYGSSIIVNEGQTAIFVVDGMVSRKYTPGRHMVNVEQSIFSKESYNNDDLTFVSKLYYVKSTVFSNYKWGTDSKIRFIDPNTFMAFELGACGTYNFKIINELNFLSFVSSIDNVDEYGVKEQEVAFKIKPMIVNSVKSKIATFIKEESINILEIDSHLDRISELLKNHINRDLEKYGVTLTEFYVSNILMPEDDPNFKRMKEQYAERYLNIQDQKIKEQIALAARNRKLTELSTENDIELLRAQTQAEIERIRASGSADAYKLKAQAEE